MNVHYFTYQSWEYSKRIWIQSVPVIHFRRFHSISYLQILNEYLNGTQLYTDSNTENWIPHYLISALFVLIIYYFIQIFYLVVIVNELI